MAHFCRNHCYIPIGQAEPLRLIAPSHRAARPHQPITQTTSLSSRKEQRLALFPARLDQAVMQIEEGWPAFIRGTRNIGDFTRWKAHDAYQQAFTRRLA